MGAYDCDCINNLEYDRRERKAQLSCEGTTSDLISRMETVKQLQGVLDVTVPITDYDEGYVDGVEFGISTVSTMPTIQPQSTTGQLNDGAQSTNLIDRQQAIDGKIIIQRTNGVEIYYDEAVPVGYLKKLPSAKPEPSIPLSWIDEQIERLKGMDNAFAPLTALQISGMVKKWRDEQNERTD